MQSVHKIFLLAFSVLSAAVLSAQYYSNGKIDSLKMFLPVIHDSTRVDCLDQLSEEYILASQKDSAEYYAATAYNEAKKINYIHGISESLLLKARIKEHFYKNPVPSEAARKSLFGNNKTGSKANTEQVYQELWFALFAKRQIDEPIYEQKYKLLNRQKLISQEQLRLQVQKSKNESLVRNILIGGILLILLSGFIVFRNIILKRRNEELRNEKMQSDLRHKAIKLEMQALRAQMNPHFIFNCLSSINRFVLKNETKAGSDYLTKFSRLIRMVLDSSDKTFITLEDEIDMLKLYMDMERLRCKNSFDYHFSFKNSIEIDNIFVPPLLLQPFAENAIWHGLMPKEGQGRIEIELSVENSILTCTITDNGIGRKEAEVIKSKSIEKQKSLGLHITNERLALLNLNMDEQTSFNFEDITDDEGNAAGTRVILKIHSRNMSEAFDDQLINRS